MSQKLLINKLVNDLRENILVNVKDQEIVLVNNINEYLLPLTAEVIGRALECRIRFHIFRDKDDFFAWLSVKQSVKHIELRPGMHLDVEELVKLGFERVSRVWQPREFSLFGDVMVVWPEGWSSPVRISLFGSAIESIDTVDTVSRKKIKTLESLAFESTDLSSQNGVSYKLLYGNETAQENDDRNQPTFVVIKSVNSPEEITHELDSEIGVLDLGLKSIAGLDHIDNSRIGLKTIVDGYHKRGWNVQVLTRKPESAFKDVAIEDYSLLHLDVIEKFYPFKGFVHVSGKSLILADFEVFGEIDLGNINLVQSDKDKQPNYDFERETDEYDEVEPLEDTVNDSVKQSPGFYEYTHVDDIFKKILPGEYIVHEDHGVGVYEGIKIKSDKHYLDLRYAGKDRLLVPLDHGSKVTKYIGVGGKKPILTTLTSGVWRRIKNRVEEDAEKVAKELVQLYAVRSLTEGLVMLQSERAMLEFREFVESFPYEDTDDQRVATEEIMSDLQSGKPMDRLLVGDVAFGKTEMALRAAFGVVNSGYQVAVLAPTTILVEQHLGVFLKRMEKYSFKIKSLSRFASAAESKQIKKEIEEGKVNIVVGTHSLLSEQVKFKNLGLIVIDEEQKFGVKQKEKLKSAKISTHVLTMSATPIPRTLNMALSGIRDISIIATPPPGRKPVKNEFHKFSWEIVKEAFQKELDRGGQTYFLHNRVGDIHELAYKIHEMFPNCKIGIAHGQMPTEQLAHVMKEFAQGNLDILICTTIIENGLDLPNANTLVVDRAEMFGLSQLYQIRGRIGRSDRQGYAHFLYRSLGGDAGLRLDALKESEELGSGFLLSNRDLEIRGAGNLLGKSQSGVINSVGYGMYINMLTEAVERLKG